MRVAPVSLVIILSVFIWDASLCHSGIGDNVEQRIAGGTPVDSWQYPWIVSITFSTTNMFDYFFHQCAGSLIHPEFVITSATCASKGGTYALLNRHNMIDYDEKSQHVRILETFYHPYYNPENNHYNVALLKLKYPTDVKVASLASFNSVNLTRTNSVLKVAGWGYTSSTDSFFYPNLQETDIPVLDSDLCAQYLRPNLAVDELCAGIPDFMSPQGAVGSCYGDGGGPLFIGRGKSIVVGIFSFGDQCFQPENTGVYTKVANILDWITAIIPVDELIFDEYSDSKPQEGSGIVSLPSTTAIVALMLVLIASFA